MGMTVILVKWPRSPEHTFVPPIHGGSIWNLALIGPAISEEKMFKECGRLIVLAITAVLLYFIKI